MKFISKEEFLQQPMEVQNKIRELWNPKQWDIFTFRNRKGCPHVIYEYDNGMILSTDSNDIWEELDNQIVPLLTMDKMIEMIENVTGMYIGIQVAYKDNRIDVHLYDNKTIEGYDFLKSKDRLHALWEVLIEIINENYQK